MEPGNEELVAKLEAEYNIEKDIRDENNYTQTIREYIENSPFEVELSHTLLSYTLSWNWKGHNNQAMLLNCVQ